MTDWSGGRYGERGECLLAPNPNLMTLDGTNTWVLRAPGHEGAVVLDKVRHGKGAFGFNAFTEEYEDLLKAGIIDPTKVVRTALLNAASIAGLMLTTEAMVAERPKDDEPKMPPGGGMGGMGGMGM